MTPRLGGPAAAAALAVTPVLASPLGRFGPPFALLVVLPPLAIALEAFGLRDAVAVRIRRLTSPRARLLATYGLGLGMSATLSLDAAAVAATSVGVAVADSPAERRWQVGGAVLASNVGSLLLPFSNLTNLVIVAATGLALTTYVEEAVVPQLAAALVVGAVLMWRARRAFEDDPDLGETPPPGPMIHDPDAARAAAIALAGAVGAVVAGAAGADMSIPFALAAAALAGPAVWSGRATIRDLTSGIPLGGLAIVVIAAVVASAAPALGWVLPPPTGPFGPLLALVIGGALALGLNNLPAAAFGAIWLPGAAPATIVAYLIGTNIAAVATPHGSVATLLAHATGARFGVPTTRAAHVRDAWRYALGGSAAAFTGAVIASRLLLRS